MNLLNLVTGAEELELGDEGTAAEGAEAVASAVAAEVAELSTQIEEQGTQIEQLADQVQELDETAEEVLDNVEGLEGMLASGAFSSIGFANIFNRTDKLAQKLGGKGEGSRLGAESISDATSAQMMARTGIEGFMETAKAWGKKAIEYIKHIFNTVISFVVGLVSAAAGIQRQAEALEKRVEASTKLKDKISLGSWNAYFDYKANGLGADATSGSEKMLAGVEKLADSIKSGSKIDITAFSAGYKALTDGLTSVATTGKGNKKTQKKEAGKDVVIGQTAGIRVMASFKDGTISNAKEAVEAARALKLVFGKDAAVAKKLSSGEVKSSLDKAALEATLKGIKLGAAALRGAKVQSKFSAAERDRVIGILNAVKATDKEQEKEVNENIDIIKATYSSLISLFSVGSRGLTAHLRAALGGVSAHL